MIRDRHLVADALRAARFEALTHRHYAAAMRALERLAGPESAQCAQCGIAVGPGESLLLDGRPACLGCALHRSVSQARLRRLAEGEEER